MTYVDGQASPGLGHLALIEGSTDMTSAWKRRYLVWSAQEVLVFSNTCTDDIILDIFL